MFSEDVEPSAYGASWLETVFAPLWRIFHVTRYGVLEGVTIDLRHPELDAWEWCIDTLWTDPDFGWQQGPNIWFPWFGPPDLVSRGAQALRWAEASAYSFDDWSARLLPTVEVTTGCTVKVARVEVDRPDGREFDHEHDAETRLAYLAVICSDGSEVRLDRPLRFRGSTSFGDDPFNSGVSLEKVAARICGMFDIRSIDSYELIYATNDASDLALMEVKALVQRAERWPDSRPEGRHGAGAPHRREALMELIDAAVSLGYRYAQAEAQRRILPFAEAGLASAQGAAIAGYRSGEARRRKAESTWHPQALELARLSRARNPSNSQDAVVADIQAGWKTEIPACPGTKTLKGFVSAKESTGELPRRDQQFRAVNRVHVAK